MVREQLRRLLVVALIGVAAGAMYLAFETGRDETPPARRGPVLRTFPEPGAVAVRQDAIGVELAFGYTARLTLDNVAIPDDQLDRVEGINRISFTPGQGKEIEALAAGRHCATVFYTSPADMAGAEGNHSWCFTSA